MRKNHRVNVSCPVCLDVRDVSYRTYSEVYKKSSTHICLQCSVKETFKNRELNSGSSATNAIMVKGKPISKHQFYGSWCSMMGRCYREKNNRYHNYGGRGITVCDEWKISSNFIKWCDSFGDMPKGTQIDRIDNDGNYEPSNCRLVTPKENARNRSTTKLNIDKVKQIRSLYSSGVTQDAIASDFNVAQTTVSSVVIRRTWN